MPLLLTNPANSGRAGNDETYTHAKITRWVNMGAMTIGWSFGTMDGAEFVEGPSFMAETVTVKNRKHLDPPETDYDDLIASAVAQEGESVYETVKRSLYEWLIAKGHLSGTIV